MISAFAFDRQATNTCACLLAEAVYRLLWQPMAARNSFWNFDRRFAHDDYRVPSRQLPYRSVAVANRRATLRIGLDFDAREKRNVKPS